MFCALSQYLDRNAHFTEPFATPPNNISNKNNNNDDQAKNNNNNGANNSNSSGGGAVEAELRPRTANSFSSGIRNSINSYKSSLRKSLSGNFFNGSPSHSNGAGGKSAADDQTVTPAASEHSAKYSPKLEVNGDGSDAQSSNKVNGAASESSHPRKHNRRHLPLPSGPHTVGSVDLMCDLADHGTFFRLYYPTNKTDIHKSYKQWPLWLPRKQYAHGYIIFLKKNKSIFGRLAHWLGGDVYVPVLWQSPLLKGEEKFPVLIVSHGIGGNRTTMSTYCTELASNGYVVAAVEHRDGTASMTLCLTDELLASSVHSDDEKEEEVRQRPNSHQRHQRSSSFPITKNHVQASSPCDPGEEGAGPQQPKPFVVRSKSSTRPLSSCGEPDFMGDGEGHVEGDQKETGFLCGDAASSEGCSEVVGNDAAMEDEQHKRGSSGPNKVHFYLEEGSENRESHGGRGSRVRQRRENRRRSLRHNHSCSEEWRPFQHVPVWDDFDYRNGQMYQRADEISDVLDELISMNDGCHINNALGLAFKTNQFKNRLDFSRVAVLGHSFGVASALATLATDDRFKTGICLDGWMHPIDNWVYQTTKQSVIFLNMEQFQWEKNVKRMMRFQESGPEEADRPMVTLLGGCHQSMTDFQFVVPQVVGRFIDVCHSLHPTQCMSTILGVTLAFLTKHLGLPMEPKHKNILECKHPHIMSGTNVDLTIPDDGPTPP